MLSLFKKYFSHKISIMPDMVMLQAIVYTGTLKKVTATKPPVMMPKFKMMGAEAGAAKRSKEFNIPAWNDTIDIKIRNGNVMRHSSVVRRVFSGSLMNPGARIFTI